MEDVNSNEYLKNQEWFLSGLYVLQTIVEEQEETKEYIRGKKWANQ
tara:strand:+ start:2486 stop:2623 length:138 start_codon:yes stop_codon:yes gene_type:complete